MLKYAGKYSLSLSSLTYLFFSLPPAPCLSIPQFPLSCQPWLGIRGRVQKTSRGKGSRGGWCDSRHGDRKRGKKNGQVGWRQEWKRRRIDEKRCGRKMTRWQLADKYYHIKQKHSRKGREADKCHYSTYASTCACMCVCVCVSVHVCELV